MINNRCRKIIIKLLNEEVPLKVKDLADEYDLSSRTIRNDLDIIDEFLKSNHLPQLIRKPNLGVQFIDTYRDRERTKEILEKLTNRNYILSPEERIKAILSELIYGINYVKIDDIAEKLMVSKSTIVKDLDKVKRLINTANLRILYNPKDGITISGKERDLRSAVIKYLMKTGDVDTLQKLNNDTIDNKINMDIENQFNLIFKGVNINYLEKCIDIAEKQLNKYFSDVAYTGIIVHMALAINRIKLGKNIIMPKEELATLLPLKEFEVASSIGKMIEEYFLIDLPVDEIGYITIHILASNNSTAIVNLSNDENWVDLQLIVCKVIEDVCHITGNDLENDWQLFNGLIYHIKPLIYRLKHTISLINPIMDEILKDYKPLFMAVKSSLKHVENYVDSKITEDEVGYFTIHFAAAIERKKSSAVSKPNVLVVCATGIGTAKLLSSRLNKLYNIHIVDSVAYHQAKNILKDKNVNIVVTTVQMEFEGVKSLKVTALLNQNDIAVLDGYFQRKANNTIAIDELIKIIEKHCDIKDYNALEGDLYKALDTPMELGKERSKLPMLKEVLGEENIELDYEASDWEDAVRRTGEILLKNGYIEQLYIDSMLSTVKTMGPYIVIGKGIALPHSRSQHGVHKIGISLLRLKTPVCFGNEDNDPVDLIFGLCAIDNSSHLVALADLARLLNSEDNVRELRKEKDIKNILQLIESASKN